MDSDSALNCWRKDKVWLDPTKSAFPDPGHQLHVVDRLKFAVLLPVTDNQSSQLFADPWQVRELRPRRNVEIDLQLGAVPRATIEIDNALLNGAQSNDKTANTE